MGYEQRRVKVMVKALFLVLGFLALLAVAVTYQKRAHAQQLNQQACMLMADAAIMTAAAAKHSVERAKLDAMLQDIYNFQPEGERVAARIAEKAYADPSKIDSPSKWGFEFFKACMAGEMQKFLGVQS